MSFLLSFPQVVGLALATIWAAWRYSHRPQDRRRTDYFLVAAASALPAEIFAQWLTDALSVLRPLKMDMYACQLDQLLGQPAFLLGRVARDHCWLTALLAVVYGTLPIAMLAVFSAYLWRRPLRELAPMVRTFVFNLFAAVPIYCLLPVCGPRFAFPGFPAQPGEVAAQLVSISAPPNGIPSVHTSTALLIAWYTRAWRIGRWLGPIYLGLMIIATLSSGQHYTVDLIAAVPYACAVYAIAGRRTSRNLPLSESICAEPARPGLG